MRRYSASTVLGGGGFDINEMDADGIGRRQIYVGHDHRVAPAVAENAARLLVLSMSLPGGLDEAILMVRAQLARLG